MNEEEVKCPDEEESEFFFESDHLALKDELMSARTKAMKDPISFVAQLQNGDLPELPSPQNIADIPYVDWSQYNISLSDTRIRPQTRHGHVMPQMQLKNKEENGKILVRGRVFDESKPETFNQLWTREEQRRLEELLVEYPPEEIEMKRWTKIANALGNRTPKQVSSRVQKYFLKLLKAGLPVPGRGPKIKLDIKKSLTHKHQRNNHFLFRRSTFFPHQDICSTSDENKEFAAEFEDDTLNKRIDDTPETRQLVLLRQVKAEKEQDSSSLYKHVGYKCTICGEEPLKGTRWHCTECHSGIDLCGDCAVTQFEVENPTHDPSHRLVPIKPPQYTKSYDLDYFPQNFSNSSYNYLDPNFLPE
ncbi:ZZ-type zinc finger-containing protein 3 isoform X2 [Nylanderia fulva]|uniref:ZZ-type zinc finger-containing protein 3 isoform X2 n=1 Tax=Nylanderia fulva TaxID=613905 RepID=UPI0010FB725E|nr:ZZ-type zinc finger-containing protein 3 isoform X2 [Nylanderia fulva]